MRSPRTEPARGAAIDRDALQRYQVGINAWRAGGGGSQARTRLFPVRPIRDVRPSEAAGRTSRIGSAWPAVIERRGASRAALAIAEAAVVTADGISVVGWIEETSLRGAVLALREPMPPGTRLDLRHAELGSIPAVVRWADESRIGVELLCAGRALALYVALLRRDLYAICSPAAGLGASALA